MENLEDCSCPACTMAAPEEKFLFGKSYIPNYKDKMCAKNDSKEYSPEGARVIQRKNTDKGSTDNKIEEDDMENSKKIAKRTKLARKSKKEGTGDGEDIGEWAMETMCQDQMWDYCMRTKPEKICGCCGLFSRIFGPFALALLFLQVIVGFFGSFVLVDECIVAGNVCELERYECRGPFLDWYWCNEDIQDALKERRNQLFQNYGY